MILRRARRTVLASCAAYVGLLLALTPAHLAHATGAGDRGGEPAATSTPSLDAVRGGESKSLEEARRLWDGPESTARTRPKSGKDAVAGEEKNLSSTQAVVSASAVPQSLPTGIDKTGS